MDKKVIIEKIIKKLEKRLIDLTKSIKQTQQHIIMSPGAMQSWSDTSKFELRGVVSNLEKQHNRIKNCIKELNKINTSEKYKKVGIGAIIKIKIDNNINFYFISPSGAASETINYNNINITTLSIDSPLYKSLLNKKAGDTIKFQRPDQQQTISILEVI